VRGAGVAVVQEAAWPSDALEVGRIVDAWGVKGWIKVQPFSSDPQALLAASQWFVRPPDVVPARRTGGSQNSSFPTTLVIAEARQHGDFIVALSPAVNDRNAAEALRGARLFVSRASFPASAEDEFYWVDLIGLAVVNRDGLALGPSWVFSIPGPQRPARAAGWRHEFREGRGTADPVRRRLRRRGGSPRRRIAVDWGADF
jgi:16S rRNA processing protein RimM